MTTTSALTSPSSPCRTTCGMSSTMRTSSSRIALVISESEPACCTIAFCGSPDETMVALNPRASASIATNTATVPAMPRIATSDEAQRRRTLRML